MKYRYSNKGEQNVNYNITLLKKMGSFDILRDIRKMGTLVQLMDTYCNINNAVRIVGHWIFESNYKIHFRGQQNL